MQQNNLNNSSANRTRRIVFIGLFGALAALLTYLHIPVFFAPTFYKLEVAEMPVLISGFAFGPGAAVATAFVKNIVKLLIKPTSTAFVGEFSSLLSTLFFTVPAAWLYRRERTKKGAFKALAVGVLSMSIFSIFSNAFIMLPTYAKIYGWPIERLIGMGTAVNPAITDLTTFVAFAVLPFNLLKGLLEASLTMLLYERLSVLLKLGGTPAPEPELAEV